jgi:hypothetical protein
VRSNTVATSAEYSVSTVRLTARRNSGAQLVRLRSINRLNGWQSTSSHCEHHAVLTRMEGEYHVSMEHEAQGPQSRAPS